MEYCPRCGAIMLPVKAGSRTILRCRSCGYEKEAQDSSGYMVSRELKKSPSDKIVIIEGIKLEVLPKTVATCPKCGNNEAYYWEVQTRSADEPATRFFKCTRCGHVWREYQ